MANQLGLSSEQDRKLGEDLGGASYIIDVDPFIISVRLLDVSRPKDDRRHSRLCEVARVTSVGHANWRIVASQHDAPGLLHGTRETVVWEGVERGNPEP